MKIGLVRPKLGGLRRMKVLKRFSFEQARLYSFAPNWRDGEGGEGGGDGVKVDLIIIRK